MGDAQGVEFLDHPKRFQAVQRASYQTLVGVDFIDHEFDLPRLMIGASQIKGWIACRVQEGGDHRPHRQSAVAVEFDEETRRLVELNLAGLDLEEVPGEIFSFSNLHMLVQGKTIHDLQKVVTNDGNVL